MTRRSASTTPEQRTARPWECACGSMNVQLQCTVCRRWAPPEAFAAVDPSGPTPEARRASRRMTGTAIVAILLGAAMQGAAYALGRTHALEPASAIRLTVVLTLWFYGLVALLVFSRSGGGAPRPLWSSGSPVKGAAIGLGAGVGAGGLLVAVVSLADGHLRGDAASWLVVSEGSTSRAIAMAVLVVVCAPLVEEWLFRGLVAESYRDRGRGRALAVSAVLFSLWHLRLAAFRYYILAGLLLGALYWKRGLVSSMSAHAAFNGTLLAASLIAVHGPVHTVSAGGVSLRVPARWQKSDANGAALSLRGPSGAEMAVVRQEAPGVRLSADEIGRAVQQRGLPVKDLEVDLASARVATLAAGAALRVDARLEGRKALVVVLPKPDQIWTVVITPAGSHRAAEDAERILTTLALR